MFDSSQRKIRLDRHELARELLRLRDEGRTIVFTNGCFDILHAGHVRLLHQARGLGSHLVVGVNDDASVARLKGSGRPILPLDQRLRILAGFEDVDAVIPFSEDTPAELIQTLRPDVLTKGGDYTLDQIVGHEAVLGWGGRVVPLALEIDISTREIIARVLDRFSKPKP